MVFQQQRAAVHDEAFTVSIKSAIKPQQSRCELLMWEGKRSVSEPSRVHPTGLPPCGRMDAVLRTPLTYSACKSRSS